MVLHVAGDYEREEARNKFGNRSEERKVNNFYVDTITFIHPVTSLHQGWLAWP